MPQLAKCSHNERANLSLNWTELNFLWLSCMISIDVCTHKTMLTCVVQRGLEAWKGIRVEEERKGGDSWGDCDEKPKGKNERVNQYIHMQKDWMYNDIYHRIANDTKIVLLFMAYEQKMNNKIVPKKQQMNQLNWTELKFIRLSCIAFIECPHRKSRIGNLQRLLKQSVLMVWWLAFLVPFLIA